MTVVVKSGKFKGMTGTLLTEVETPYGKVYTIDSVEMGNMKVHSDDCEVLGNETRDAVYTFGRKHDGTAEQIISSDRLSRIRETVGKLKNIE